MTAEQILEKHLLSMSKRTGKRYSIEEMKQQSEWQVVINAMLEYGEMQALRIHDVVGQSEQLVAFCRWYNQAIPSYETTEEEIVETYLRESN